MKCKVKISYKSFKEEVELDQQQDTEIVGQDIVQINENVFIDIKKILFLKDGIVFDCIYLEKDTIYGRCYVEATNIECEKN